MLVRTFEFLGVHLSCPGNQMWGPLVCNSTVYTQQASNATCFNTPTNPTSQPTNQPVHNSLPAHINSQTTRHGHCCTWPCSARS
jgi:hypothetical protein